MSRPRILYIDPDVFWVELLESSVGEHMDVIHAVSRHEAKEVLAAYPGAFSAVIIGIYDSIAVLDLVSLRTCPLVAASWLPKDNRAMVDLGCTHMVERKQTTGQFLIDLLLQKK